jgi:HEAT repeat protein/beta-lactamase regulating signal transducer with metallopeptidase domain
LLPVFSVTLPQRTAYILPKTRVFSNLNQAYAHQNQTQQEERNKENKILVMEKSVINNKTTEIALPAQHEPHKKENESKKILSYVPTALLFFWFGGTLVFLFHFCVRIVCFSRISRKGREVSEKTFLSLFSMLKKNCGINRKVRLITHKNVPVPVTFGLLRPVLIVPENSLNWSKKKKQMVLFHELFHIKRWDYLFNLIAQAAYVLFWFNPLLWPANRQFQKDRENACDDCVLKMGAINYEYADLILEVAKSLPRIKPLKTYAAALADKSKLKTRIKYILSSKPKRSALTMKFMLISLFITALILFPLTITKLRGKTEKQKPESINEKSYSQWVTDLKSGIPDLQIKAAWSLGEWEKPQAVPALILSLKDKNPDVRAMAAWALGEIKDKRALLPLIEALEEKNPYTREIMVKSLGELELPQAVDALIDQLKDKSQTIRCAAVWSLGEIKNQRAIQSITSALQDTDPSVRKMAINILGRENAPNAGINLIPLLSDKDRKVRETAAYWLGNLGEVKAAAALIETLSDHNPAVRREAAFSLGKINDTRAVRPLTRLLTDKDPDVRSAVVWALDEINIH